MNLRQLEVFAAVAETGSFSRAAEEVLLTQSTVSQHVAALENQLGVKLFDRTGRGAELTEAGQLFRRHARQVLVACAELRETMARFCGLDGPELTVGASNIPANYLLPSLLPELAVRHSGIVLNVVAGDSREIIGRLLHGEFAVAVVGSRCPDQDVEFTPLLADTLRLVVGVGHPWRGRQLVELAELAGTPLLTREAGSGSGRAVEQALQTAGLPLPQLHIAARLGSNEAVKQAVMAGCGAAFLSALSVERELASGDLAVVTVAGLQVERRFWLALRRGRSLSPAADAFVRLLTGRYGAET
jgi:LysR family transcriptional regulator, low CO2-responsive transcriptional regulator